MGGEKMKVNQSKDDYIKHLTEQYYFLKNSCDLFDKGFSGEAKRIATTIRVLVHDTYTSTSLLTQLNSKNIYYYNTAYPYCPLNMLAHLGLIGLTMSNDGGSYYPFLDDTPGDIGDVWITFNKWWTGNIVLSDTNQHKYTRKDLVLLGANKDGGAHIDPILDDKYVQLSRENAVGWTFETNGIEAPLADPHLYSIRQIGHEMMKTIENKLPDFKK